MDPSPFHEKDLDSNAHEHIVSTAKKLSGGRKLSLGVYLAKPIGLPDEGKALGEAIRVYFARQQKWSAARCARNSAGAGSIL